MRILIIAICCILSSSKNESIFVVNVSGYDVEFPLNTEKYKYRKQICGDTLVLMPYIDANGYKPIGDSCKYFIDGSKIIHTSLLRTSSRTKLYLTGLDPYNYIELCSDKMVYHLKRKSRKRLYLIKVESFVYPDYMKYHPPKCY